MNLSPSPCLRRTRALEEKGVIKGYTAIVDERAYGLPVTALVRIRLSSHTGDVVKLFEKKVHETEQILARQAHRCDSARNLTAKFRPPLMTTAVFVTRCNTSLPRRNVSKSTRA